MSNSLFLFPIGILTATNTSKGAWTSGGASNTTYFEPNGGSRSHPIDTTLVSQFENHSRQTREKVPIHRIVYYTYEGIWRREYEVIERFFDLRKGRVHSFHAIDLSAQERTTGMSISGGNVTASISDTHRFSLTAGNSGYYACCYKPKTASLVIGKMVSISADANVVFTASWGDLSTYLTDEVFTYPIIEVFFADNLNNFSVDDFNPEDGDDRGYTHSGECVFIQSGSG